MMLRIFTFCLLFAVHSTYAYISIPLNKERNPLIKGVLNDLLNSSFVYNEKSIHPSTKLQFKTFQYYGRIKIGTPKQSFDVSFSTLTPYVYIPSNMATVSCGPKKHHAFIESDSKTFNRTDVTYNGTSIYTKLENGFDTVEIDGIAVSRQPISLILDGNCDGLVYDGVVGLELDSLNKQTLLLYNLYKNQMIPQYTVGLRLKRDPKCRKDCGEIVFGGWNNAHVVSNSIRYISASSFPETKWKIVLDKVVIGSREVSKNRYAVLDIGSSFIRIPESEMKIIQDATGVINFNNSLFLIDETQVKNLPSLTFNIDGKDYTLNGADYVDTVDKINSLSIVLLTTNDGLQVNKDAWVLGDAFIGKYYTILDYANKKVAFAAVSGSTVTLPTAFITCFVVATLLGFWTS